MCGKNVDGDKEQHRDADREHPLRHQSPGLHSEDDEIDRPGSEPEPERAVEFVSSFMTVGYRDRRGVKERRPPKRAGDNPDMLDKALAPRRARGGAGGDQGLPEVLAALGKVDYVPVMVGTNQRVTIFGRLVPGVGAARLRQV